MCENDIFEFHSGEPADNVRTMLRELKVRDATRELLTAILMKFAVFGRIREENLH